MRDLKKFYIIKKDEQEFQELMKDAVDNDFYYPPFHYNIKIQEKDYNLSISRGRPLYLNNGLVRISNISDISIGIVLLYNKNLKDFESFGNKYYENLALFLKELAFDFDIEFQDQGSFVTSIEKDEKVDIAKIFKYVLYAEQNKFKILNH